MKEGRFYEKLEKKRVKCNACNHFCQIDPGNVGICGVRRNLNGALELMVQGKAAALNVDPIEKKPLYHFLPGSFTYSFGTLGCNLRCDNCQNFEISQVYNAKGKIEDYEKINWGIDISPEEIITRSRSADCQSISYTYTEPTIFAEYALDTMKLAREQGLKNVWVSNGYMSKKVASAVAPFLDAINVDIKSFDENFYAKNCGAKLDPVLENCKYFFKQKIWTEITTLIIPGKTDSMEMIREIAAFIKNELGNYVPWHLSAFSGAISWKMQDHEDTSVELLKEAYLIGKREGLKNIYLGNVSTKLGEDTLCENCGMVLVKRRNYEVELKLSGNKCPRCGIEANGLFNYSRK